MVEEKFFNNEQYLRNKFSFERLGNNLHFLGCCPEEFKVVPTEKVQRLSKMLFNRLTSQTCMNADLMKTLLYSQIRAVIDEYIKQVEDINKMTKELEEGNLWKRRPMKYLLQLITNKHVRGFYNLDLRGARTNCDVFQKSSGLLTLLVVVSFFIFSLMCGFWWLSTSDAYLNYFLMVVQGAGQVQSTDLNIFQQWTIAVIYVFTVFLAFYTAKMPVVWIVKIVGHLFLKVKKVTCRDLTNEEHIKIKGVI